MVQILRKRFLPAIAGSLLVFVLAGFFALQARLDVDKFYSAQGIVSKDETNHDKFSELRVTYLGTSTVLVSDGHNSILTDGFFTRPSLTTLLFSRITPDVEIISETLTRIGVVKLDAVIPVHSHHDHLMDSPEVAMQTGAILLGSESSINVGRSWGLPDNRLLTAKAGKKYQFGDFLVSLIESPHTEVPSFIAWLTGIGLPIDSSFEYPAYFTSFKEGVSYSVLIEHPYGNLIVHGSGGFKPAGLEGVNADLVFLGLAGISKQSTAWRNEYFNQTIKMVGASRVIPVHWDDFTVSLSDPVRLMPNLIDNIQSPLDELNDFMKQHNGEVIIMKPWDSVPFFRKESK